MDDDHPLIAEFRKYMIEGVEDRPELYARVADHMSLYNPADRLNVIAEIDKRLDDDNSTLRQRAQAMNLRRGMQNAHEALLRAKR